MSNLHNYDLSIYQSKLLDEKELQTRVIDMAVTDLKTQCSLSLLSTTLKELSVGELEQIRVAIRTGNLKHIGSIVYNALIEVRADEFEERLRGTSC